MISKKSETRIVLDTNIWISFTIGKRLKLLSDLLLSKKLVVYFSNEIIEEYKQVISRKKFAKYITQKNIEDTLELIHNDCIKHSITTKIYLSRDVNDNFLLALSKEVGANYLITGDNDLLTLKKFEKTHIITFSEFMNTELNK